MCGRSARTVRREGRPGQPVFPTPIVYVFSIAGFGLRIGMDEGSEGRDRSLTVAARIMGHPHPLGNERHRLSRRAMTTYQRRSWSGTPSRVFLDTVWSNPS